MIEARIVERAEFKDLRMIAKVCFHGTVEDPESLIPAEDEVLPEGWGAFAEDGTLLAGLVNHRFQSYLDGTLIENGGIGGVSTLPEYRNTGAVRAIFTKMLPASYRAGEVISTLFPFNHAFYRKFGYEVVCSLNQYELKPEVLQKYRFTGRAELWKKGDPIDAYLKLYYGFAEKFNLPLRRTPERMMKRVIDGDFYKDRKFCYLLSDETGPIAYVVYQDVKNDPKAILRVLDLAFTDRTGFLAILGFLGRFTADYGTIQLPLPAGIELYSLIQSPKSYEIQKTTKQSYMVRVIHAKKLLAAIQKPEEASFVIRVSDEWIPENNGTFSVSGAQVRKTTKKPDLVVSVRALAQLGTGAVSLLEASLREDVEILGNEKVLSEVFRRKPLYIADHF